MSLEFYRVSTPSTQYARELARTHEPGALLWDAGFALASDPDALETIRRDPATAHAIEQRKHLVAGRTWRMVPASDREVDQVAAGVMEDLFRRIRRFAAVRFNLAEAVFRGSAWGLVRGARRTLRAGGLAPAAWWCPAEVLDVDSRRFRQRVDEAGRRVWQLFDVRRRAWEDLGDRRRWFVRSAYDDTEETLRFGRGLVEALYYHQYAKTKVLQKGLDGLERWAQGMIRVKVGSLRQGSPTRDNDAQTDAWLSRIEAMRARHVIVHGEEDDVQMVDGPAQGHQMVTDFLAFLTSEQRILVLGSNLPTEATEGGSFALAQVQENSTENLVAYDRDLQDGALTEDLVGLTWRLNLPLLRQLGLGDADMPAYETKADRRDDPAVQATVVATLLAAGVPLRRDEVYAKTGFTPPGERDEVLEGAPAAGAPFGEIDVQARALPGPWRVTDAA